LQNRKSRVKLKPMFLAVHASIGGLIGEKIVTAHQWLAFVLGFLSHFILDMIPHNDDVTIDPINKQSLYLVVASDLLISFFLMLFWLKWLTPQNSHSLILGMFGAVLPDGIWGIHEQWKIKGFGWFHKMHNYIHRLFSYQISRKKALLGQIAIIILVSYFLK